MKTKELHRLTVYLMRLGVMININYPRVLGRLGVQNRGKCGRTSEKCAWEKVTKMKCN